MKLVEIEVDGPRNQALAFRPLPGRVIRGRFDLNRIAEPMARLESAKWPMAIPGQRIGVDAEGVGFVAEPLHAPENAILKEKIEKAGMRLAPKLETFEGIDAEAWLYWLARAVAAGVAKVVTGELPAKLAENPRKNFIIADNPQDAIGSLKASIDRQSELLTKLLERLASK